MTTELSEGERFSVMLGAELLQARLTSEDLLRAYVGRGTQNADEVVTLAKELAAARGAHALEPPSDANDAQRVTNAAQALVLGLASPEILKGHFAGHPNADELASLAMALASKQGFVDANERREAARPARMALEPSSAAVGPADPDTSMPRLVAVHRDPMACLRGRHVYSHTDSYGRRICGSCGQVNVVTTELTQGTNYAHAR